MAQIQRAAKEIHSAVSGTQIPKVERVFRVICTTQVFFFSFSDSFPIIAYYKILNIVLGAIQ